MARKPASKPSTEATLEEASQLPTAAKGREATPKDVQTGHPLGMVVVTN
jgi:hypothetical protein